MPSKDHSIVSSTFLLFLLLISSKNKQTFAYNGKVTSIPDENENVIYSRRFRVSNEKDLRFTSDIPVTTYRYTDNADYRVRELITSNHMYLFVKTNCVNEYNSVNITLTKERGYITTINVTANPLNDELNHISPLKGDIKAEWTYSWFWCGAGFDDDNDGIRRLRRSTTGNNVFQKDSHDIVGDVSPKINRQQKGNKCGVVAEIVYDGCKHGVKVDAPSLRVSTANMKGQKEFDTEDKCTKDYEGIIKPVKTFVRDTEQTVTVRKLKGTQCDRWVEGRPFIDATGSVLQSEAIKSHQACWARDKRDHSLREELSKRSKKQELQEANPTDEKLALDWIKRSLGEHSSVASFAALTISLLTNNAPPELIRDSLHAAMDEVNHATTSFRISSLLSGDIVEPGPLPPSSLYFEKDVQTLAWRTFKEGCVDETISAVVAAVEASSMHHGGGGEREELLQIELSRIALDEARHAALAFRTVQWACTVESQYCRDTIATYFNDALVLPKLIESRLAVYGDTRNVQNLLEYMYDSLLESVTGVSTVSRAEELCEHHVSTFDMKGTGIVNDVINEIMTRVLCGSGSNEHEAILDSGAILDQK